MAAILSVGAVALEKYPSYNLKCISSVLSEMPLSPERLKVNGLYVCVSMNASGARSVRKTHAQGGAWGVGSGEWEIKRLIVLSYTPPPTPHTHQVQQRNAAYVYG